MNRIRRDVMFYCLGMLAVAVGAKYGYLATIPVSLVAMTLSMWKVK